MNIVIAQFAKAPILGKVKTRLTPHFSEFSACEIHILLLQNVVNTLVNVESAKLELWTSSSHEIFEAFSQQLGVPNHRQADEGLGVRLAVCAKDILGRADAVILVGSDCPYFDAEYMNSAVSSLHCSDVDAVISAAEDGGYVLLGIKQFAGELFEGIDWSTERVFSQTMEKFKLLNWKAVQLPILEDIDRPEDVFRLSKRRPAFFNEASAQLKAELLTPIH